MSNPVFSRPNHPALTTMPKQPRSDDQSEEISLFIKVNRDECNEFKTFLEAHGIKAAKHFGIFNSLHAPDMETINKLAEKGTPYLLIYAIGHVLVNGLNALAKFYKKRLKMVKSSKGGIEIDATNFTVAQLKDLKKNVFDTMSITDPVRRATKKKRKKISTRNRIPRNNENPQKDV
jgi:hypothetical protein